MSQSSIASCNAALNARNSMLNNGKVEIRTGVSADIDQSVAGDLLETIPLKAAAFKVASNRAASANLPDAVSTTSVAQSGAKHYVAYSQSGNVERVGNVGIDMVLTKDLWGEGENLSISSWVTAEAK